MFSRQTSRNDAPFNLIIRRKKQTHNAREICSRDYGVFAGMLRKMQIETGFAFAGLHEPASAQKVPPVLLYTQKVLGTR